MQPTFTTERLVLRPVQSSDVDALWTLWAHPDVRRFLFDDRLIERDDAAGTVGDCIALSDQGLGLWLLYPGSPGTSDLLGCAGLFPVTTAAEFEPRLAGMVEPLVALAPNAWHHGYAHEALGTLLTYASATLGIRQLAGVTDVPNDASDRMLRRAGFTVLGESDGPRHRLRTYVWDAPTS